ncbi:uncharacterized protein VTP21DRAFT_8125 [Calcarisporiella thermophila]|uniref:uncharacterized protein n=1 Tax=Calcarisporiella thermophila TaxID=911321 RepID=UPI00374435B2
MYTRQMQAASMNTVCSTSANNTVDETENCLEEHANLSDIHLPSDALYFQLKLNSFTDLHNLLSAQYLIDGILLPENIAHPQMYTDTTNREHTGYCSYFKILSFPKPIDDKIIKWSTRSNITREKLLIDRLFHVYLSACCVGSLHPDREAFLESYFCCELEPALVHTSIANAAIHLIINHPETPISSKLHVAVGSLIAQAKQSLADVFDAPSPQIVLAFINMNYCLTYLSLYKDAYKFYSQAAQMALSLHMDKNGATEKYSAQLEFQRRIWAIICTRELEYVFEFGMPSLISMDVIKSSPKPTVTMKDSERFKFTTITTFSKLLELQNIDWALPDVIITQKLAGLAAYLQNERTELIQYCSEGDLRKIHSYTVDFDFWFRWCALWRQFIKSDAPAGRLETNLMQQLRDKAFREYVKQYLTPMKPTRKKIRERVLELSRKGESTRKVAARIGISHETARKIIKEWSTPKYPPMKPKYGRPRSLSESGEKYIAKKAATGECSNLADLQQVIKEELNKSVTNKTVKMMLRRHEVKPRSKPRKPFLLPRHFKTRFKFTAQLVRWDFQTIETIIFSDETIVPFLQTTGNEYTYVKKGQPLRECNIIPTTKQGKEAIMVWGCITSQGVGLLLRVEGGINARMYQIILDEGFLGTLERYGIDKDKFVFQHDNAPPHIAKSTQAKRVGPLEEEASRLSYSAKG